MSHQSPQGFANLNELPPTEQATAHFYLWELLGRGWLLYTVPVDLEPAYTPFIFKAEVSSFHHHAQISQEKATELRRYSDREHVDTYLVQLLKLGLYSIEWMMNTTVEVIVWVSKGLYRQLQQSKWLQEKWKTFDTRYKITQRLDTGYSSIKPFFGEHQQNLPAPSDTKQLPPYHEEYPLLQPDYGQWIEMDIILPDTVGISLHQSGELIRYIASSDIPVSYEIIASSGQITLRIATSEDQSVWLKNHLELLFPGIVIQPVQLTLKEYIFMDYPMDSLAVLDFGYANEWMFPIRVPSNKEPQTLTTILSLMDGLEVGDTVIIQTMCQGVVSPWQLAVQEAITLSDGSPFFVNAPTLTKSALQKSQEPFLATSVRILIQCMDNSRVPFITQALNRAILQATRSTTIESENWFTTLRTPNYELIDHFNDFCNRASRRAGMLLSVSEVTTLFHFPPPRVRSKKFITNTLHAVPAPHVLRNHPTMLGTNTYLGTEVEVSVSTQHRLRHTHIIGATGSGKSTFLLHLMKQDIQNNNGFAILDPHGDTIEAIIPHIPKYRIKDVVLIDPSDSEYPIGFNIFSAKTEVEKIVLSSDITGLFRRFASSWGDQMEAVLSNAINVLLDHPNPQTLITLRRFLVNESFRKEILNAIDDDYLLQFWQQEFKLLRKQSVASIITRLDTFLRPKIIRLMMEQTGGVDVSNCIKERKIVLVKLSQGLIGTQNAHLLGSLFTAKLYQAAQGRQAQAASTRHPFFQKAPCLR